jgi:hypothetical protein
MLWNVTAALPAGVSLQQTGTTARVLCRVSCYSPKEKGVSHHGALHEKEINGRVDWVSAPTPSCTLRRVPALPDQQPLSLEYTSAELPNCLPQP